MIFFKEFFKNSKQIGSIIPSSRYLSETMVSKIDYLNSDVIVELGAGTGVFTEKLIKHLKPNTKLFIFEINELLYKNLCNKFTNRENIFILNIGAENLSQTLSLFGVTKVDYVISGLPFLSFSQELRNQILKEIEICLEKEFILFQYTSFLKREFEDFYKIKDMIKVYLNFPPANVYTLIKKESKFQF